MFAVLVHLAPRALPIQFIVLQNCTENLELIGRIPGFGRWRERLS